MSDYQLLIDAKESARFSDAMKAQRPGDEESLGFWFCDEIVARGQIRLRVRETWVPDRTSLSFHSRHGVTLDARSHLRIIRELRAGRTLVHLHTHPGSGRPRFSAVDDHHERRYARFLERFTGKTSLFVSGVYSEDLLEHRFRLWPASGMDPVSDIELRETGAELQVLARQEQFGESFRERLAELHVGLVGCGGLGAVVAEQLGRLGVRRWTLVDPDVLEEHNLNRMPAATSGMARAGWYKTAYVRWLLRRAAPGTRVRQLRRRLRPGGDPGLAACDLILACTDNDASRLAAQEAAARAGCRLMSLGVNLEAGPAGMRTHARIVLPPADHSWCLVCSGAVNADQAAREELDGELREQLQRNGYLQGVPAPAVYWLNSLCASAGVGLVHRLVLEPRTDLSADWILAPDRARWHRVDHQAAGCFCCRPGRLVRRRPAAIPADADPLFAEFPAAR